MSFSNVGQLASLLSLHKAFIISLGFTSDEVDFMHLPVMLTKISDKRVGVSRKPVYNVTSPFAMDFNYAGTHYLLIVDKDNRSNLATVPWFLQWVLKADDRYVREQAVAHDVLVNEFTSNAPVRTPEGFVLIALPEMRTRTRVTSSFADIIFRELIEESLRRNLRLNNNTAKVKAAVAYGAITAWRFVSAPFK